MASKSGDADPQFADFDKGPLGRATDYPLTYTPALLHPMNRAAARTSVGVSSVASVHGEDLWTAYEFSWLNLNGKPEVAGLHMAVDCQSTAIVESKSVKLYLNSFSQTRFPNRATVLEVLQADLSAAFQAAVDVLLLDLVDLMPATQMLSGECLDSLDVEVETYERDVHLLTIDPSRTWADEQLVTHLFRSLCPVTAQPDWASIVVGYCGTPMSHEGLLKYLISYRNHQAFHETTIEQIYCDLRDAFSPERLTIYGRFQRRGGLDINPFRASFEAQAPLCRLPRQ
ncbi:MAG: NADPH-dependent 7-cyano-7-deazaguanine reductase QueF [Gammaproteobacteria bacterium]|jgi:7-cyano-7-deazaguanine reductase|nr:NADPH-dependent 7-cyano-7-deazaguanine reductase QueF [Gammaproteobacteria bacterium]